MENLKTIDLHVEDQPKLFNKIFLFRNNYILPCDESRRFIRLASFGKIKRLSLRVSSRLGVRSCM
jgi:hypothetical protein